MGEACATVRRKGNVGLFALQALVGLGKMVTHAQQRDYQELMMDPRRQTAERIADARREARHKGITKSPPRPNLDRSLSRGSKVATTGGPRGSKEALVGRGSKAGLTEMVSKH